MSYLLIVVLIGLLILVHELGHFLAARWVGIPVRRFSIGFGPKLWSFTRGDTEYSISAIPLGGYVLPAVEDESDYFAIPAGKRILFALGGPLANIILPVGLFMVLNVATEGASIYGWFVAPFVETTRTFVMILASIPRIFVQPEALSGVVGIVAGGAGFVGTDIARALRFTILLSVNLAVFNLLPIPVLDGGKILLTFLEKIYPKAIRLYVPLSLAGVVLMVALLLYATVLDIGRLIA